MNLTEVVVSTLLVGIVLVGALNTVGGVQKSSRGSEQHQDGVGLAHALMAEILQQRYEEPTDTVAFGIESPETSDSRDTWDDIDDYHGWSSAPELKNGNKLAGFGSWTRSVDVVLAELADPTKVALVDEGLKKITVKVTDPKGRTTVLDAYRSKWGVLESALDADATVQTMVTSRIQVKDRTRVHGSVHLPNYARDE